MRTRTAGVHGQDLLAVHPMSGRRLSANELPSSAMRHVAWLSGGMMLCRRG